MPSSAPHDQWDELAAGHALHALEPEEEARLQAHLGECDRCRAALDDYLLVAAQLAQIEADDMPAPTWQDVREKVMPDADVGQRPARVSTLVRRAPQQSRYRRLTAAAAAAVIVAGGVAAWQLSNGKGPSPVAATVNACQHQPTCRVVRLRNSAGTAAAVLVATQRARLLPVTLAQPAAGRMYVLWQMPRDGRPVPVSAFSRVAGPSSVITLRVSYRSTAAFALSLERSGPLPAQPSAITAVGAT